MKITLLNSGIDHLPDSSVNIYRTCDNDNHHIDETPDIEITDADADANANSPSHAFDDLSDNPNKTFLHL